MAIAGLLAPAVHAEDPEPPPTPCTRGRHDRVRRVGLDVGQWLGRWQRHEGHVTRIDKVRASLGKVLPNVTRFRRVGLITYGPGPWQMQRASQPRADGKRGRRDHGRGGTLTPSGKTPLPAGVVQAAEVLEYRTEAGVIVLLTDGEETCGGSPCSVAKLLRSAARQLTVHVIGLP